MKASIKARGIAWLLRWGGSLLASHAALAAQLFRTADSLAPADLPPFVYARALWNDRKYADAKLTLIKILAHTPEHAEANNLLGVIFFDEEKMELARQHFMRAIIARPDFASPLNNLGNIHHAYQELDEAARCYRTALERDPDYVESLTNLSVVLNLQGDNATAEAYCRKAIRLTPKLAGAHCNLGNILLSLGRFGEAVAAYREAHRLQPDLPEALVNLALVLEDSSYLIGTIEYYEKQLQRQPGNYLPHLRIGQALHALKRWDDAWLRLRRALELKPGATDTLFVLGVNYFYVGDVCAGIDCLRHALVGGPNARAQAGIIFDSLYLDKFSGYQLRVEYRNWAEQYLIRPSTVLRPRDIVQAERRLSIGYVSRDFTRHSAAYFFEPILKNHDRYRVKVFCYSTLIKGDDFTDRFRMLADVWRDISTMSEKEVVKQVSEDNIDILVDLSGHTAGNRLDVFACKPAPIQVTYLGHPTTTGLAAIDYRFGDTVTDPAELTTDHYVEQLWQLPSCFLTYQPPNDSPPVAELPLYTKGHVTFGSFNNVAKINDHVIAVWAEILTSIPSSRLLLKSHVFTSSRGRARIVDGFSRHSVDQTRIELVDWRVDVQNHLELYGEVDIALDTFPYNGTTTSCEALWMGVPVICLEGDRHSARVGASLLTVLGLGDLLAKNSAEYVSIAVGLAGDPARQRALRESMRNRMRASTLLDHSGFTRRLEQAYREMWRIYCDSSAPSRISQDNYEEQPAGEKTVFLDSACATRICVPYSLV